MTKVSMWASVLPAAIAMALAGCAPRESTGESSAAGPGGPGEVAVAELQPTAGHEAHGTVTFRTVEGGVLVNADLEDLEAGEHGFHIHETGDCGSNDASSAGGHFAPQGSPHGAPDDPPAERHLGDLGNLLADAGGKAGYERIDPLLALHGENSIIGRAVIVHQKADDLESQPSGAAGPRVACGVISPQDEG